MTTYKHTHTQRKYREYQSPYARRILRTNLSLFGFLSSRSKKGEKELKSSKKLLYVGKIRRSEVAFN